MAYTATETELACLCSGSHFLACCGRGLDRMMSALQPQLPHLAQLGPRNQTGATRECKRTDTQTHTEKLGIASSDDTAAAVQATGNLRACT